ncbi:MAG: phosphoglycerate dehydrogenase [Lachnospiraceae bacterium]|nr:phosphoglycerate dehydrogenase [Lachnospiraceae bacterium]
MKILVTPSSLCKNQNSEAMKKLRAFSDDIVISALGRPMTEDELIDIIGDIDGYIAGTDHITAKVIAKADKLKVISRYGAGVDSVDLDAAKAKGIAVTNTPGANSQAVAELAFGHMLALARKIEDQSQDLKHGKWVSVVGKQLQGKTLGVLGFGNIGRRFAKMSTGLDMKVMAYDPFISHDIIRANGAFPASLDEIYANADVITMHLPLSDLTHHMIDAEAISKMKDGVILINTARGGILDEDAVYDGVVSGKIFGVGLDSYVTEPPKDCRLMELPNVITTPHAGAHTKEAVENMSIMSVENVISVLSGEYCPNILNR